MSTMQPSASAVTPSFPLSIKQNRIISEAVIINIFILVLILISQYSTLTTVIGGLSIILYLSIAAVTRPIKSFFLIFGIKLTFDALWFIRLPIPQFEEFKLLEFSIIPMFVLILMGPQLSRQSPRWPIIYSLFYILWIILAMVLNGYGFDLELLIRQSGIFLGLLIGLKYIKNEKHFSTLVYLMFISTIIPVLASAAQIFIGQIEIPIFHYKIDTIREYRYSGLYYDPATAGMVNVISLLSNAYLISSGYIKKRYEIFHKIFIPLNIFIILAGGTRSIIGVGFFILLIFFTRDLKKSFKLFPFILLVILLSKPFIDQVTVRSAGEIQSNIRIADLMLETDYRTIFTGRVSIWQDIWYEFSDSGLIQRLLGTGMSSNAHSSYFFLLLQIGWLGLMFYVFFNISLIVSLFHERIEGIYKISAILMLGSLLTIGISATTAIYTSFQWIVYLIVGGVLNMGVTSKYKWKGILPRIRF